MTGRELLGEWLKGRSRAVLIQGVPISNGHLSQFLHGKKGLSRTKTRKISAITGIAPAKLLDLEAE